VAAELEVAAEGNVEFHRYSTLTPVPAPVCIALPGQTAVLQLGKPLRLSVSTLGIETSSPAVGQNLARQTSETAAALPASSSEAIAPERLLKLLKNSPLQTVGKLGPSF